LTEIYLGFEVPALIVNLMTRSRYRARRQSTKKKGLAGGGDAS
jgi:hypothetical protein